jgi:XTP/dITP diphosphohydrolase
LKILLATTNEGKVRELRQLLKDKDLDIEILSLKDMDKKLEVEEDKETFLENAIKKATSYAKFYKLPVIAEDSGLEVDALNGLPGIYSARFFDIKLGKEVLKEVPENLSKDEKNNLKLLRLLENQTNRKARYKTALIFYNFDYGIWTEGVCEGQIAYKPEGNQGFGYDPIFVPEGYNKTMAQLTPEEKNKISHRGKAVSKLVEILKKVL